MKLSLIFVIAIALMLALTGQTEGKNFFKRIVSISFLQCKVITIQNEIQKAALCKFLVGKYKNECKSFLKSKIFVVIFSEIINCYFNQIMIKVIYGTPERDIAKFIRFSVSLVSTAQICQNLLLCLGLNITKDPNVVL